MKDIEKYWQGKMVYHFPNKFKLKLLNLLYIAGFFFIYISLYVIITTPLATGYEISIYDVYPWYFWVAIISSILCGVIIIIIKSLSIENSKLWYLGIFFILFANSLFYLLPIFRGYVIYGQGNIDLLTHIGYIKDIVEVGYTGENMYPILHILIAILIELSRMPIEISTKFFQIFMSILYTYTIYILVLSVSKDKSRSLLSIVFASPLIFSFFFNSLHPSFYSLYFIPLILYFSHGNKITMEKSICILILSFAISFFHPITVLFMIGILFVLNYSLILFNKKKSNSIIKISMIMFVTFFAWYFSFSIILHSFARVSDWLFFEIGQSVSEKYVTKMQFAGLEPFQLLKLIFAQFGAVSIYFLISIIGIMILLYNRYNKNKYIYIYAIQMVFAIFTSAILWFGFFIESNSIRILRLPILILTILNGIIFIELSRMYYPKKNILAIFLILIISITTITSIFNVYFSPITFTANAHLTKMELYGAKWSIEHFNPKQYTTRSYVSVERYKDYLLGKRKTNETEYRVDTKPIPSHFGYDNNISISKVFDFTGIYKQERYMVTNIVDRVHLNAYPENIRYKGHIYNETDFVHLRSDNAVGEIYSNGEFEVWRLYGNK